MDDQHTVIDDGNVLVRNDRIVAIWAGERAPFGTPVDVVLIPTVGTIDGKLNLEGLTLTPLLTDEDEFFFDVLGDRIDATTGLLDDPTPPFKLYPSNENQLEESARALGKNPKHNIGPHCESLDAGKLEFYSSPELLRDRLHSWII